MIFETKTTQKIQPRLGKWSSLFLVTLIVFSGLFSFVNKPASAADTNTATGTQGNTATGNTSGSQTSISPCNPNRNIPSSYQQQAGLSIYNCLARDAGFAGETGGTTYTMWYILLLDGKKLPTKPGSNQCDGCTVTWLLNGKEQTRNKDQVEYGKLNTMSLDKTIGATVNINGQVLSVNKDAQKVDEVTKTEDMTKKRPTGIIGFIQTIIQAVVFILTGILQKITQWVLIPLIKVVLDIKPHDPSFAALILGGWVFVRNIMNIFFIIAMLIIALATLFKVEKINYKHLVPELVINMLLINFSLVIAQLILGIADTLQAQFIPNNTQVLSNLSYQLMVKPNLSLYVAPFTGSLAGIVSSVFYLFLAFASFLMFGAIAVLLLIRVVALWILLLLSPVAFATREIAGANKQYEEWKENFLKWAFFTPIIGFFLHIIASLANIQAEYISKVTEASIPRNASASFGQFVSLVVSNLLILFLLYMALEISQELSPKQVGGVFKKVEHWSLKPFEFAGEGIKDAAMRKKYEMSSGLLRNEKGEVTDSKFKRAVFSAVNPGLATHNYLEEVEKKNKKAKEFAVAQTEMLHEFRESKGIVDTKQDLKFKNKKRDEELERVLKDSPAKNQKIINDLQDRLVNHDHHAEEEVVLRMEAMAKTGKIEMAVSEWDLQQGGDGTITREKIINYTNEMSHGNDKLAGEIRKKIADKAKDSGFLVAVGLDESDMSKVKAKRKEVVDNVEAGDVRKINLTGIDPDPNEHGDLTRSLKAKIGVSGVRYENLPIRMQEYLGIDDDPRTHGATINRTPGTGARTPNVPRNQQPNPQTPPGNPAPPQNPPNNPPGTTP